MKIFGFLITSLLVLSIAVTAFAVQEDMMKKQPSMMSKKPSMSVQKKRSKPRKIYKHRKGKKIIRKFTVK